MSKVTLSIIGAGNMGAALCQAFVKQKVVSAKQIISSDHSREKLKKLQKQCGIRTTQNNQELLKSHVLLLAVKPQGFPELAKELRGKISAKTVVISIMAGIPITSIAQKLQHERIVRAMPNTPALVGEGVTGWFATSNINTTEKKQIQKLLSSTGFSFELSSESQMDNLTILSGCGPGFFFYVIEEWLKATKRLDLGEEQTKTILLKTLKGSLTLAEQSSDSLEKLRQNVTSKGGITEAGLKVLQTAPLQFWFEKTFAASKKRTQELHQTSG